VRIAALESQLSKHVTPRKEGGPEPGAPCQTENCVLYFNRARLAVLNAYTHGHIHAATAHAGTYACDELGIVRGGGSMQALSVYGEACGWHGAFTGRADGRLREASSLGCRA
jgi:hypothetical protein